MFGLENNGCEGKTGASVLSARTKKRGRETLSACHIFWFARVSAQSRALMGGILTKGGIGVASSNSQEERWDSQALGQPWEETGIKNEGIQREKIMTPLRR